MSEFWFYLIAVLVVTAFGLGISACSASLADPATSQSLIERTTDLQHVSYEGKSWFAVQLRGCGESDTVMFRFSGTKASTGERVRVETCQGWPFKGATIRG